jgi:hypothetical protein
MLTFNGKSQQINAEFYHDPWTRPGLFRQHRKQIFGGRVLNGACHLAVSAPDTSFTINEDAFHFHPPFIRENIATSKEAHLLVG